MNNEAAANKRLIPCEFVIDRETGEILSIKSREMSDDDFMRLAAAVWGLKIERRKEDAHLII